MKSEGDANAGEDQAVDFASISQWHDVSIT